jgi:hypothetical protein
MTEDEAAAAYWWPMYDATSGCLVDSAKTWTWYTIQASSLVEMKLKITGLKTKR